MKIELRDFQPAAVEGLRDGIRSGNIRQILCAPTGAGKTVIGAYLLQECAKNENPAAFIVDRVALAAQTSRVLWDYEIQHGMAQGSNTFGRNEPIQIVSAQTAEKRGWFADAKLIIVDEAHTMRKGTIEFVERANVPTVGLTATPFSKGLGNVYSNVVNVTTTDNLIEKGLLAPLHVYAAKAPDMTGAKLVAGEWSDREVENRGREIIGDIVSEYVEKTQKHFGGPVKTLVFSATVDHGEELCKEFQAAGLNFQQVSYKDGNDERRTQLIDEFRRADSSIIGLISCEALAKGFDVPDVLCGIGARPYRKSFSSHIQMIGRAMRSFPGKEYALWLDHAGNYLGFYEQMLDLFAHGVSELDDGERGNQIREEVDKEASEIVCSCGYILSPAMEACPACGKERVRRNREVERVDGHLIELGLEQDRRAEEYNNQHMIWQQLSRYVLDKHPNDPEKAIRRGIAMMLDMYGSPSFDMRKVGLIPADSVSKEVAGKIMQKQIAFAKRAKKA